MKFNKHKRTKKDQPGKGKIRENAGMSINIKSMKAPKIAFSNPHAMWRPEGMNKISNVAFVMRKF